MESQGPEAGPPQAGAHQVPESLLDPPSHDILGKRRRLVDLEQADPKHSRIIQQPDARLQHEGQRHQHHLPQALSSAQPWQGTLNPAVQQPAVPQQQQHEPRHQQYHKNQKGPQKKQKNNMKPVAFESPLPEQHSSTQVRASPVRIHAQSETWLKYVADFAELRTAGMQWIVMLSAHQTFDPQHHNLHGIYGFTISYCLSTRFSIISSYNV